MYKYNECELENSYCLECGEPLYGRSDKKFCNAGCRNAFHGHIRSDKRMARQNTLSRLARNYEILERLIKMEKSSCPLGSLTSMGFRPEFVTQRLSVRGHSEYRCYDIAYSQTSSKIFNLRRM